MSPQSHLERLQVIALTDHAALAELVFETQGAEAVSVLDATEALTVEPAPGQTPAFDSARVVGQFPPETDAAPIEHALREAIGDACVTIASELLPEADWTNAWRAYQKPRCFGQDLWVAPTDSALPAAADRATTIIRLDPGLAFGTGSHPTTALCLAWLAEADLADKRVLDYGCGSGILAITAAHRGAKKVVAVDTDPKALIATRDNAALNGVAEQIDTPAIDDVPASGYDVVLANILAAPLIELAPTIAAHVAPDGWLVLSGLLSRHVADVRSAYADLLTFEEPRFDSDWVALAGRRQDTSA
mgnify:CR=1 FL=1